MVKISPYDANGNANAQCQQLFPFRLLSTASEAASVACWHQSKNALLVSPQQPMPS
jgi:hypothetical protein